MASSIAQDHENSDFDVNILEDAFTHPNINLTFPLPTDKEKYIDVEDNEKVSNGFRLLHNFVHFFTGINVSEIYSNNEYRYSVNKHSKRFNKKLVSYMDDQLKSKDAYLDKLVSSLVQLEIRLKLTEPKNFQNRFTELKSFVVKYYHDENSKNMPYFNTPDVIRICYVTVVSIFQKMFPNGLWCSRSQFSALYEKYLENPMSIIFLPNHQSHLDYMIIHVICVRFQLSVPTVIAGDNLNVAIFGRILRQMGAIFIKRSFSNEAYTEQNLTNLIEFILENKIHLEVFIEGTRSRDGKLLLPKYGILKALCNIYLKQRTSQHNEEFDMLMQPISITYERVYEADGYLNELVGKDKKQENTLGIIKNGLSNMFTSAKEDDLPSDFPRTKKEKDGDYDNSKRRLHGKIFIKLGTSFTLSSFVEEDKESSEFSSSGVTVPQKVGVTKSLQPGSYQEMSLSEFGTPVNIKKLGFKILHEINRVSYLPEISIIGASIQAHYYYCKKDQFSIKELLPVMRLFINVLSNEAKAQDLQTNVLILNYLKSRTDEELAALVRKQVPRFFRLVKINFTEDKVIIHNSIELLYHKNLTIHLIIHQCLACFLVQRLARLRPSANDYKHIHKLYYIFTGLLKNEFLFDYNYNNRNELSTVLSELTDIGHIGFDNNTKTYYVVNDTYVTTLAEIVTPFVYTYIICIESLLPTMEKVIEHSSSSQVLLTENSLFDEKAIAAVYPTTKSLLKIIQKSNNVLWPLESVNKQYLLSVLFYLDHINLLRIVKNKTNSFAYVTIENRRDLLHLYDFLYALVHSSTASYVDDIHIEYIIDIVDKTAERSLPASRNEQLSRPKL